MTTTGRKLLENFDDEVREKLRVRDDASRAYLSQLERRLIQLTAHELNGNAEGTLRLWRYAGSGPWTPYPTSALDTTDNWVESNAVSNLSWWAISQFFPLSHRLYLPLIRR